jgi:uncharacterized protein (DUF58 family)
MPAAEKIPGIHVDVDELIGLRAHLAGLAQASRRRRASYRSGGRDTRLRGRGMEYEESRAYMPGDDFRTMDWRLMARTGEPYSKVFAEEKERRFLLAVDLSPSMYFGTRHSFKSWAAAQLAAHLGWLASFSGDRIGGLIACPDYHREVRPGRTRAGLLGVFHHLAEASRAGAGAGNGASRLDFLLRELYRVVKPGAIIALISDFIGLDEESMEILSAVSRHNEVGLFWIHDDTETEAWPGGHYQVMLESRRIDFTLAGDDRDRWLLERQQRHRQRIEELAATFELALIPISCNHDIGSQVLQSLKF